MTEVQALVMMMLGFGSMVAAIIFGISTVVLGILNLIKKK